jgi:hypothetical protein
MTHRVADGRAELPHHSCCDTGADGRFEAVGLNPGPQPLRAWRKGMAPRLQEVELFPTPGSYVEIVLDAGGVLAGIVLSDDGKPAPGIDIQRQDAEEYRPRGSRRRRREAASASRTFRPGS